LDCFGNRHLTGAKRYFVPLTGAFDLPSDLNGMWKTHDFLSITILEKPQKTFKQEMTILCIYLQRVYSQVIVSIT